MSVVVEVSHLELRLAYKNICVLALLPLNLPVSKIDKKSKLSNTHVLRIGVPTTTKSKAELEVTIKRTWAKVVKACFCRNRRKRYFDFFRP